MNEDYLWSGKGRPDPEVKRLERRLASRRHPCPPPELPELPVVFRPRRVLPLVAAAVVLLVGVGAWILPRLADRGREAGGAWSISRVEGVAAVGDRALAGAGRLPVGAWLETDEGSRARIDVPEIGYVDVEPHTRIRVKSTGKTEHRLELAQGRIEARVSAPPRLFVIDTPAAAAVDLGCAYLLDVAEDGSGLLRVTAGWVALEAAGRSSIVPSEAACATRPGIGPGTPYFEDASPALRDALARFDFEGRGDEALEIVLAEARERDTLTLWHLVPRVDAAERGRVVGRAASLRPLPEGVDREALVRLDPEALALWKDDLEAAWW